MKFAWRGSCLLLASIVPVNLAHGTPRTMPRKAATGAGHRFRD